MLLNFLLYVRIRSSLLECGDFMNGLLPANYVLVCLYPGPRIYIFEWV